jgi:NADH-quinone oxidoreductase subunit G
VLASPFVSTEELFLLKKLSQAVGVSSLDTRLRYSQEQPAQTKGAAWLGLPIAQVSTLDFVLVVGSFLRREHPLLTARVRDAANRGANIASIYPAKDDWHLKLAHQLLVRPSEMPAVLSALAFHVAKQKNLEMPGWAADNLLFAEMLESLTKDLVQSEKGVIWLGAQAYLHTDAKSIHQMAAWITQYTGLTLGFLPDAANRVGAQVLGYEVGVPALKRHVDRVDQALDLVVLWNIEPRRDVSHVAQMARLTQSAQFVVATAMYKTQLEQMDVDLILPVVPFTETPGSFINFEGRLQAFEAVVPPLGDAKEGWRLLQMLATMLNQDRFDYRSIDDVRADVVKSYADLPACIDNEPLSADVALIGSSSAEFERLAEVGIYATDPIVRRSASLQQTKQAQLGRAFVNQNTVNRYALKVGAMMRVVHRGAVDVANSSSVIVPCGLDNSLMDGVVRLALNQDASETLSGFSDAVDIVAVS